jgi:hypothetical protein
LWTAPAEDKLFGEGNNMNWLRLARVLHIVFACLLLSLGFCAAQEFRGSITGTALDPQGAGVPGARVTVTETQTNVSQTTTTNNTGFFEVPMLNPGIYSVTVEATGFKKAMRSGLPLSVGGRLHVEMRLEIGAVAESVEVTAAAPPAGNQIRIGRARGQQSRNLRAARQFHEPLPAGRAGRRHPVDGNPERHATGL